MFEYKTYSELPEFEKKLAQFGDRVSIVAGLQISGKMSAENAYQEIKRLYKELKQVRKEGG